VSLRLFTSALVEDKPVRELRNAAYRSLLKIPKLAMASLNSGGVVMTV
jgi:hypothetical protein